VAKRAAALVVAGAKIQVWEEFWETMENDFQLASRMFWQIIRQLRKESRDVPRFMLDLSGELLIRAKDIGYRIFSSKSFLAAKRQIWTRFVLRC